MMICDYCKQDVSPTQHTIFVAGPGERAVIASIDLCKGCAPIFKKKITDLVREVRNRGTMK